MLMLDKKVSMWTWVFVLGLLSQLSPLIGILPGAFKMISRTLELSNLQSNGDSENYDISVDFFLTMAGIVTMYVGLVLMIVSIHMKRRVAKWMIYCSIAVGILHISAFPFGTVIGALLLAVCLKRFNNRERSEKA